MKIIVLSLLVLICCGFTVKQSLFIVPKKWAKPVYDFSQNELSENKIELGKQLFYDPILSANNKISCASCHSPYTAFTHIDHALSHGIHDSIGTRNSPALFNLAWQKKFMWDGAIVNLDMQALAPISHPAEMGSSINLVVKKLSASAKYKQLFFDAFQDSSITGQHTLKAIAQFMITLVSANSKYDRVKNGQEKFSVEEANGYKLFKKNCNNCHTEPLFTNENFENNGLAVDPQLNDFGRWKITHLAKDSLLFKVPSLRNIAYTAPYMHDGRFKKLSQVINYYMMGIVQHKTLSKQLNKGVYFTSNEKIELLAFLNTLTDKEFISNPKFLPPPIQK
jgi:cytochrome c peroxidase